MLKRSLFLPALLLSLGLAAGTLPAHADDTAAYSRKIVTEDVSPANFASTLTALKTQFGADGWTLLAEIDLGARIAKKGTQLPGGLVILELASGGKTIPLLKNESTRYIAGLMPCSVSIYGLDDGRVVVSRMNTAVMAGMMEPAVAEVLKQSAARLDASIAAALTKAGS